MDTIPTLHHVNLKTTRLREMIDWYDTVVGLKPQHVDPVGAWLTNDAANHRLALLAFPGISDDVDKDSHSGLHHMAFEFSSLDELLGTFARLRTLGITPSACLDHGVTISMYYADPDRNVVELQVDNFHDWAKSSEYMRTSSEFAADPIGVVFDPDRAYDAFQTGKTHEELHRTMMAGRLMPDAPPPLVGLPPRVSLGPLQKQGDAKMDVVAVAEKFCAGWTSPDAEAFSMLFAPEACYTDIAFGIARRGRDQIMEHHRIWRTALPEFVMLNEHTYESGSTVIVKTVCYGSFSGGDLGGGKLKATFKSFRARAISVLELNEQSQILACTEYYDKSTMPIGDETPFDQLPWPHKDLAEALSTKTVTAS